MIVNFEAPASAYSILATAARVLQGALRAVPNPDAQAGVTWVWDLPNLTPDQVHDICLSLCRQYSQDCVAVYNPATGEGDLIGPRADAWRPFNPAFFHQ